MIRTFYSDGVANIVNERRMAAKLLNFLLKKEKDLKNELNSIESKILETAMNYSTIKRMLDLAVKNYNSNPSTENGNRVTALSTDYLKTERELYELKNKAINLKKKIKKLKKPISKASNNYQQKTREVIFENEKKKKADDILEKNPEPNESCRPDVYNKECDSGVGPSGDPRLILMKKGGLGRKLIELASQKIINIPAKECDVITKTCDGNNIEVTATELKMLIESFLNI
jgi:chromosome segregation ATPase